MHRRADSELLHLHLAAMLVLPGEHAFLLHQHLPKGPHFLPDLLFGVPGWAKMRSGLPWWERGLPRDLLRTSIPSGETCGLRGLSEGEVAW